MEIKVKKASGVEDLFSLDKLKASLRKSGAKEDLVNDVSDRIASELYDGITTKEIYKKAFKLLNRKSKSLAGKYNLKAAIMLLGPTGYPFERFVAEIMKRKGYRTQVKKFMQGTCVTHEIDVYGENDSESIMMECKYHSQQGNMSDVKVPLYIHSRYNDVKSEWEKNNLRKLTGWVVTNTRFSSDAIKYGQCCGLNLLGWDYPVKDSLQHLIDKFKVYPVTCLNTLTIAEKVAIIDKGIVLAEELQNNEHILDFLKINEKRKIKIMDNVLDLKNQSNHVN